MLPCFLVLLLDHHMRLPQRLIHRMPRALERAGDRRHGNATLGHIYRELRYSLAYRPLQRGLMCIYLMHEGLMPIDLQTI